MKANPILTSRKYKFPYLIGNNDLTLSIRKEERKKLGQELHDNVNQILGTVKLYADMLCPDNDRDKDIRNKITEYVLLAVSEIRNLSSEMVHGKGHFTGLIGEIQRIIDNIRFSTSIQASFQFDESIEAFSYEKKICLLRIAQEQLKNVVNYSEASELMIGLRRVDNTAMLTIRDNGKGFNLNSARTGIGIKNIYDRTRVYDGTVTLESAPGHGCSLAVRIPF